MSKYGPDRVRTFCDEETAEVNAPVTDSKASFSSVNRERLKNHNTRQIRQQLHGLLQASVKVSAIFFPALSGDPQEVGADFHSLSGQPPHQNSCHLEGEVWGATFLKCPCSQFCVTVSTGRFRKQARVSFGLYEKQREEGKQISYSPEFV